MWCLNGTSCLYLFHVSTTFQLFRCREIISYISIIMVSHSAHLIPYVLGKLLRVNS